MGLGVVLILTDGVKVRVRVRPFALEVWLPAQGAAP